MLSPYSITSLNQGPKWTPQWDDRRDPEAPVEAPRPAPAANLLLRLARLVLRARNRNANA